MNCEYGVFMFVDFTWIIWHLGAQLTIAKGLQTKFAKEESQYSCSSSINFFKKTLLYMSWNKMQISTLSGYCST